MVVAQLAEGSLPIPEVRGSNPVELTCLLITVKKTKIKKKEAGNATFIKTQQLDSWAEMTPSLVSGTLCRHDVGGAEDVEMGKCLQNLGVVAGDSRDENGGPRFFALSPGSLTILV